ncbi:DUF4296 domain-containing protein [Mucilaginibacter sp. Bleaf8]|uniref:DUF4296 domain-containing protein n=1 Tax=Mucilaginibacter sp. Bleaf8 TaxID=2834430 RepID=UPI001BCC4A42|nr:DUF4296 domain-containing protein [Mucilaginibacter sp. Bleaf8]MBS7562969.1 DUF4296 domain-containing protein [Mucilaginibacter sp. Bleaf8]
MRIYIILFFLAPVILLSCKGNETPPGILDKEQMAALLVDVHTIDGALATVPQFPDTLYKYGMGKYLNVFKQHHTDSAQFKKSFKYYVNKPDQLDAVYDDVINRLNQKTDSVNKVVSKVPNAVPAK